MKAFYLLIFSLISSLVYAQDTSISKKNISSIFSQNANGKLFNWDKSQWDNHLNISHKLNYEVWLTSGDDSIYFKSDTIKLYNYSDYKIEGENTIIWTFFKKNKFGVSELKKSKSHLNTGILCCNKIKIKQINEYVYLTISSRNIKEQKFKVIDLSLDLTPHNSGKHMYILTLKRIK